MTKNLPVPTADEINKAHEFARESAGMAVEWAVKCGQLLAAKKEILPRGEFDGWVRENCQFGRSSAYAYMKVADKSSRGLDDLRTIQQALGYDKPKPKPNTPKEAVSVVNPPGDGQDGTEETGNDRPAVSAAKPPPGRGAPPPGAAIEDEPAPEPIEVTPPPDFDFEGYEPEDDDAFKANIENALMADDRNAALIEELKNVHRELTAVKSSRDHYQNQAGEAVRLVKAKNREIERLRRDLEKARAEIEALKETA
jgi:hypothetical protein